MTPLAILAAMLNTLWQAAAVAALVWLVLKFVRTNAATRSVIWWAVLVVLFALPVAPRLTELWHRAQRASASSHRSADAPATGSYLLLPEVDSQSAIVTLQEKPAEKWPFVVFALWAAVLVYRLARIGQSYLHLGKLKRKAVPSDFPLEDIGRQAILLVSRDVASPMAVGFLRPAIILPEDLTDKITREELDQILLHEAAHLARRDDWTNLLARIVGAVLALHPVAWWILRQIEYEREAACDDWVVARTGAVLPYAESLAHMVELRWAGGGLQHDEALASGVFGRGSRIGDRIEMLLECGREFSPRVSFTRVLAGVCVLCCLAAASTFAPRWIAFAKPPVFQRAVAAPPAAVVETQQLQLIAQAAPSAATIPLEVPAKLVFEVASIRPHDGPLHTIRGFSSSGPRLTLEGYNLPEFILEAYNLKNYQVTWGPAAALSDTYYDVQAKAEGDGSPTKSEFRQMLKTLLAERFNFKFHRETKEMPVYALVVGKNGPKFKESDPDAPDVSAPLHLVGVNGRNQYLTMTHGTMESVADFIPNGLFADRPVLDKTGLTGKYTLKLEATPEMRIRNNPQPEDLSVFDAVQQQLGLKLEAQKADIEILVVDHIEKPSEN